MDTLNKTIILILFSSIFFYNLSAQNNIFIFEEGEEFYNKEIERNIKNLTNKSITDSIALPLFKNVFSKRELKGHYGYEIDINDLAKELSNKNNRLSEINKRFRKKIVDLISTTNHILRVNTIKFDELLEFQMTLFVEEKDSTVENYAELLTVFEQTYRKKTVANFFIAPKEEGYDKVLEKAIKKLFPETNFAPSLEILLNNQVFDKDKVYTYNLGDTIFIDASYSFDWDDNKKNLRYKWQQIMPTNMKLPKQREMKLVFDPLSETNKILPPLVGKYTLEIEVDDGVSKPVLEQIVMEVIKPVRISINQTKGNHIYLREYIKHLIKQDKVFKRSTSFKTNYDLRSISDGSFSLTELDNSSEMKNQTSKRYPLKRTPYTSNKIIIDKDTFIYNVSNASILLHENYNSSFDPLENKIYSLELFVNNNKMKKILFNRQYKFHGPLRLRWAFHHNIIKFPNNKIKNPNLTLFQQFQGQQVDTTTPITYKKNQLITEWQILLSKNIKAKFFLDDEIYEEIFTEELYLDDFQTSVMLPYRKALDIASGFLLSFSTKLHKTSIGVNVGLNKYHYTNGTPSERTLFAFQYGVNDFFNDLGKLPETRDEILFVTLLGEQQAIADSVLEDIPFSSPIIAKRGLVVGVNLKFPIFNLPFYIDGEYNYRFSHKELPFNSIHNWSYGITVDFLGLAVMLGQKRIKN